MSGVARRRAGRGRAPGARRKAAAPVQGLASPRIPAGAGLRLAVGWLGVACGVGLALLAIQLVARDRATDTSCFALWGATLAVSAATASAFRGTRMAGASALWVAPLVAVFVATPSRPQSFDTYPTRYLAVSLAERRDFDLDEWPEQLEIVKPAYWLHPHDGHLYSAYPPGAALFAAPLWPFFRLAGFAAKPAPVYALAKTAAALAVALAAATVHAAAKRHGARRAAFPIALGFALASGNLALASQDLWQHGPAELGLAIALWGLAERSPRDAVWVGFGLGLAALMRPFLLSVAGVATVVWALRHRDRDAWARLALGLVPPLAIGAACNLAVFGTLVGGYSRELRGSIWQGHVLGALLGNALSPSRGLLVFAPWVVFAVPGALLAIRRTPQVAWVLLAPLVAFFGVVSLRVEWWAGHGYGPRYPLDVLPFVAFLAAIGVEELAKRSFRTAVATLAPLLVWGTLAQLPAFLGEEGRRWSGSPNVDRFPERLWSVGDGQLAAGWNEWLRIARSSYAVARMRRGVGEAVVDRRFLREPFVACAPAGPDGRGYLALGPGDRFGAGRWRARFRLAIDHPLGPELCARDEPAAVLDVASEGGVPVWARRELPACAGGVRDVDLAFDLPRRQRLELRVETTGAARVCASRIEIGRLDR